MSEQKQNEPSEKNEPREVQMEEMTGAVMDSVKQGVDWVAGGIGSFAKYSLLGFQYAGGDIKQLTGKVLEKVQKRTPAEEEVEATA